jgi:hypothetical protein
MFSQTVNFLDPVYTETFSFSSIHCLLMSYFTLEFCCLPLGLYYIYYYLSLNASNGNLQPSFYNNFIFHAS